MGRRQHLLPAGRLVSPHFNAGKEPARHWRSAMAAVFSRSDSKSRVETDDDVFRGVEQGGSIVPYEDEDPEIPQRYQAALKANGVGL